MSWKEILKIALDKEGNTYGQDKYLDGPLTGPAMVLAEKKQTPIYVVYDQVSYEGYQDGFLYDNLEEAKKVAKGNKIITVKPTDKKTLMIGLDLYEVAYNEQDFENFTQDFSPSAFGIVIDNYLKGKSTVYDSKSQLIYNALKDALLASRYFSGYEEDTEKVKEQLEEVLEELDWMKDTY